MIHDVDCDQPNRYKRDKKFIAEISARLLSSIENLFHLTSFHHLSFWPNFSTENFTLETPISFDLKPHEQDIRSLD